MMEGTEADLLSLDIESDEEGEGEGGKVGQGKRDSSGKPSFMREPSEEDLKLAEQAKKYGNMVSPCCSH